MKKYLLTFICVFCISVFVSTCYVLISSNNSPSIISQNDSEKTDVTPQSNVIADFTNPEIETLDKKVIEEPLEFMLPVNSNEIGMKFSNGQLLYSKTLDEWIMHNGIDIIAKLDSPVYASEEGKIIEISSNVEDGIKIIIEHKDGYKTVYSNLSTTKMVQEGQLVKKGETISKVGKSSNFEYNEKDHLHFEIYKDGDVINPLSLI